MKRSYITTTIESEFREVGHALGLALIVLEAGFIVDHLRNVWGV